VIVSQAAVLAARAAFGELADAGADRGFGHVRVAEQEDRRAPRGVRSVVRAAYAVEASVVELTFIFGPPLALVGALWSTGAALAAGGIVLLLATTAFAAQPPAMRTLVIVLIAVGVLLGADEVAVVAAAKVLDSTTAAAPLRALWGVGSTSRRPTRTPTARS
jgi:hypothetical protein